MATTISSGTNPYKLGSPPDFGTLYSGRALDFDGVADYVSLGEQSASDADSITMSAWVKIETTGGTIITFGECLFEATTSAVNFYPNHGGGGGATRLEVTTALVTAGYWHHLVVTRDSDDEGKLYIDGALIETDTSLAAIATNLEGSNIGVRDGLSNYFDGKITNVQIWDKVWSLSDVQYAYTHPEKLITDNSSVTSGTTISNLKAWYPCTEGNPRSPQTTVYDGSPKELGDNIITGNNSTFASGEGDWAAYTSATVDAVDGALKIVKSGTGTLDVRAKLEFSSTFDTYSVGTVWELSWDMWKDEGLTATTFEMSMAGGSGSAGAAIMASSPVSTTRQSYSGYFTQINSGDIITNCHMVNGVGESADIGYYIDNITLKEVKMGNHGTTTFYGTDLQTGTWTDGSEAIVGFGSASANGFVADNDVAGNGNGDFAYGAGGIALVVGRSYKITFNLEIHNSNALPVTNYGVSTATDGTTGIANMNTNSAYAGQTSGGWWHYLTFVAQSTATHYPYIRMGANGVYDFTVTAYSITEVGVATGWTTADAEPLIPQTALMGMSKQAQFLLATDIYAKATIDAPSGDYSTSAWIKPEVITPEQDIVGFGGTQFYINNVGKISVSDGTVGAAATALTVNKWYHVVMTYDTSANKMYAYSNGSLVIDGTTQLSGQSITANLTIGANSPTANHFTGNITEVSYWSKVLSLLEVQELFNDGSALDSTTHSASSSLVGYWRNEGTSTWTDRSANSNNATVYNSPDTILLPEGTTTGKDILGFPLTHTNNGWLNLAGSEYVDVGDNDLFTFIDGGFSLECWFRMDATPTANTYLIAKQATDSAGNNDNAEYGIFLATSKKLYFRVQDDSASAFIGAYYNTALTVGRWYHLVCTHTVGGTTSATCKIYLGETATPTSTVLVTDVDSETGTYVAMENTVQPVNIGAKSGGYDPYNGSIDEVRIYNRELVAAEITKNYKHGKSKHS